MVIVPVLSTQRTDTAPSVSTEGSFLTSDFFLASRHAPIDRKTVSMTGNSSGIIAIASVMPDKMLSMILSFIRCPGILKNVIIPTSTNNTAAVSYTHLRAHETRHDL